MVDKFHAMPVICPTPRHTPSGVPQEPVYFFVILVKFPPGKTPMGFMQTVIQADPKLKAAGKKTRHERGIHEEYTFVTLGRYDMVTIWHAPDLKTMGEYWEELHAICGPELGQTETLVVTSKGEP